MAKKNTGFTTAHMDVKLHAEIKKEALRNKLSFSEQIREYREKAYFYESQNADLKEELRTKTNLLEKITDVN